MSMVGLGEFPLSGKWAQWSGGLISSINSCHLFPSSKMLLVNFLTFYCLGGHKWVPKNNSPHAGSYWMKYGSSFVFLEVTVTNTCVPSGKYRSVCKPITINNIHTWDITQRNHCQVGGNLLPVAYWSSVMCMCY